MSGTLGLKPLVWVGSSKKDLLAMLGEVQDVFGYALHLAQSGSKHEQAKPLRGYGSASVLEVVEDWHGDTYRAVYTMKFTTCRLCSPLLSEEGDERDRDTKARPQFDHEPTAGRGGTREGRATTTDSEIHKGSTNVYTDLGRPDAEEMLIKAQLATKIGEIIKRRHLTQIEAADIIGLPQPKLSGLLRGQFRGISEAKMLNCLTRLGRDVKIIVGPARRGSRNWADRSAVRLSLQPGFGETAPMFGNRP